MESLINDEWFRQEAETRRIVVTDAEVQDAIDKARESGFLSDETLERSGLTLKDLARNARETQLHGKVTEQLTDGTMAVSARDIADYYRRHKAELVVSERRDLRLILTKTRTKARAAMLALNGGQSWVRVAKEYSLHDASRDKGGRVTDLRKGPLQSGLTATVFRAKKGELWGPVKADETSWAVFLVERIEPAFQATLDQARDDIREYLVTQRKRRALAAFTKKYREMTTCARGFRVPACKNGPKET
jgi:foldase protein PrsA